MGDSRTKKAIKNSAWALIGKLINLILNFLSRTVLINYLGEIYLGVNGVYTEILAMLSLAELGFGTAINFAMYKPVADEDEIKVKKLLSFYKKVYRVVALIVATLGLLIMPLLPFLLKGTQDLAWRDLRLYYVVFLFNTIINYFIAYKFSYLNALQKNYVVTFIDALVHTITCLLQVLVLVVFKSFFAYLLIQTFVSILFRFGFILYLHKKYPILKMDPDIHMTKEEKAPIYTEVKGLIIHQFSSVAVHSTDNIIISSLNGLGVVAVGLISNYNLIITGVLGFISVFFSALVSSFGNLAVSSSTKDYENAFKEANFLGFWLYGFCAIAFLILIPPFIELWLGAEFLIDSISFFLIIINSYLLGISTVYNNVRVTKGGFEKDKWVSLAQAIVNLIVSIIAAQYYGLMGVYLGTIISRIITIIFRPLFTYRYLFNKNSLSYFKSFLRYLVRVIISGVVSCFIIGKVIINITMIKLVIAVLLVLIIPNIIFLFLSCRDEEFKRLYGRFSKIIKRSKSNEK